jgi:serine/threonine-protein kinase
MMLRDTYLIHERLASGGMGEVYLATHVRLPGKFAVKVLGARLARDPHSVARFCREAAIVSVLRHPNIVQVYDFNVTPEGVPFLVMECLEGRDLAHRLVEGGPMPLARVTRIVRQIAGALESAHVRGIVHRDLKPANVILLDWEGHPDFVKVLDFGVSKICGVDKVATGQWTMLGTPAYMAPEQALGRTEDIDGRTDQFSLAVLAYVLLTGTEPFPGQSTPEVLHRIVDLDPLPLGERVPWPAREVEAVLRRALAKRRDDRFARVLPFAEALDDAGARVARAAGMAATAVPLALPQPSSARGSRDGASATGATTARLRIIDGGTTLHATPEPEDTLASPAAS